MFIVRNSAECSMQYIIIFIRIPHLIPMRVMLNLWSEGLDHPLITCNIQTIDVYLVSDHKKERYRDKKARVKHRKTEEDMREAKTLLITDVSDAPIVCWILLIR